MALNPSDKTETIGRLPHLLTHVAAQLPGLSAGADTFDDLRQRYGQAMSALAARGLGRITAPRAGVGSAHRYWSSTRDLIKELQILGWIEGGIPVPSTKQAVDTHRNRRYPLTTVGREVAATGADRRALADALTDAALASHPYLRGMLEALAERPMFCPEVAEGQVQRAPSRRHWAEHAVGLWQRSDPGTSITIDELDTRLAKALRRRFGRRRDEGLKATPKEVAEAMNDAFADAALASRGLSFGATTLDQLKSWGMELRLLDQSRYVPGHIGGNLLWITCDVRRDINGTLHARRRAFSEHGVAVGRAVVEAFMELRDHFPSEADENHRGKRNYLPIHVVRALAALRTGTSREIGDRALEAMAGGELDFGMRVRLLAARFELPPRSEPMYQRGGTRALMLTMTPAAGADA
jgi:hypothetical protein